MANQNAATHFLNRSTWLVNQWFDKQRHTEVYSNEFESFQDIPGPS